MHLSLLTSWSHSVSKVALQSEPSHLLSDRWVQCTDKVNYSMADISTSMLPVYQNLLLNNNLRILVYSGDVDAVVPHIGGPLNTTCILDCWKIYMLNIIALVVIIK